jgi:pimeloyl-ACP methyl ester carboxylesterase
MSSNQLPGHQAQASSNMFGSFGAAMDYAIDAAQRTVLFWDVMRQRGNQYREHMAEAVPNVLSYEAELIIDGRTLKRPVNYGLVRIVLPEGVTIDPRRRPFVIVDPRAGHGPGIGGFKADSEVGVILKAGHPCYFVGFLPEPMPGQTIEDIARAEAIFLEKVIALHPDAEGKPGVIGNCQGGWAVMMLAAIRAELFGPIIIAGSPLSYWGGVHGKNPMRYSGGLLGGSWLTALTSDLGGGKFDGAWLVQNFENQNPANTLWTKQYNVYSKIDTEAPRYLGFERYWGGHVLPIGSFGQHCAFSLIETQQAGLAPVQRARQRVRFTSGMAKSVNHRRRRNLPIAAHPLRRHSRTLPMTLSRYRRDSNTYTEARHDDDDRDLHQSLHCDGVEIPLHPNTDLVQVGFLSAIRDR